MAKNKGKPESSLESNATKKQRGNPDMLVSLADRTPEERAEIARQGGIASGEAKRAKRKTSELLHAYLEKKFGEKGDGLNEVLDSILAEGGAPAISILKLDIESNEPKKIEVDSNVTMADITRALTKEQKLARLKELTGKKD